MRAFVLVLFVALDAFAAEEEQCNLPPAAVTSQFDAKKLPKGAKLTGARSTDRTWREVLRFADGLEVMVQAGGCKHLGVTIEVRSKKLVSAGMTPTEGVAVMTKVLGLLPLKQGTLLKPLMDGLATLKTPPASFPVALECQVTVCELALVEDSPALMLWSQVAL